MNLLVTETPVLNKARIIIDNALLFLKKLIVKFNPKINDLLCERLNVQDYINEGKTK